MRKRSMSDGRAIAHLWLATLTLIVATSYLTLLLVASEHARRLAAGYGAVMFMLAAVNLICYLGGRRGRSRG